MPRITKRLVDSLRPDLNGGDLWVWDDAVRGFGIRMKPTGSASYIIQYRNEHGRTRRYRVARVGTLTPEEARKLAKEKLGEVDKGADPSQTRREARKAMTVAELCEDYLTDAKARGVKSGTLAMDRSRVDCHVKPLLGTRSVAGLTGTDIEAFQAAIAAGRTAKGRTGRGGRTRGGRGAAARTVGMLRTILELGRRRKLIASNPVADVRRYPERRRDRFLSHDELKALGKALRSGEAVTNRAGAAAITFLLLSGCRRMEALSLRWRDVDFQGRCLRLPDTKSGPQVRPLGKAALEALGAIAKPDKRDPDDWVFPAARGKGHLIGLPRMFSAACKAAGIEGASIHTLRHSFAAVAAEMGFSELTIAGLLGHRMAGVTARYAHVPDRALLLAADAVSGQVLALLEGRTRPASNVVKMRQRVPA